MFLSFKPCDRQAGAAPKPGKLKTNKSQSFIPYYADAERKELKVDKSEVDLEGINGQLYKGRFQKVHIAVLTNFNIKFTYISP
jgi:hypothetical protein